MVGKIRDSETVELGIKEALRNHVLSTLTCKDSSRVINNLLSFGIS